MNKNHCSYKNKNHIMNTAQPTLFDTETVSSLVAYAIDRSIIGI